jgi:hypothetical protein
MMEPACHDSPVLSDQPDRTIWLSKYGKPTLLICSGNLGASLLPICDGAVRGMAVIVARTHAYQGQTGTGPGGKPWVLIAASMVGNLGYIAGWGRIFGHDGGLGSRLNIARQDETKSSNVSYQHDACIIWTTRDGMTGP